MNPLQKEEHIFPVTRRLIQLLDTVIQLPRVIKAHDHSPDVRNNKKMVCSTLHCLPTRSFPTEDLAGSIYPPQTTIIRAINVEAYSATGKIHLRQQAENQKEHVI